MITAVAAGISPSQAQAQELQPALPADSGKAGAGAPESVLDVTSELAAMQSRLEQLLSADADLTTMPLLEERRNLVSRLVLLLSRGSRPPDLPVQVPELPVPIGSGPTYSMTDVDALRDTGDGLKTQVDSLAIRLQNLNDQIDARLSARQRAEEAQRLKVDILSRERDQSKRERLLAEAEVARLEARIAEVEVSRFDRDRQSVRERLGLLRDQLDQVNREIARVRGSQFVDDAHIERIVQAAMEERRRLDGLRRATEQLIVRRETAVDQRGHIEEARQREVQALRERLNVLSDLNLLETGREEAWRQRRWAIEALGTKHQAEAVAVLRRSIEQLETWLRNSSERLTQARAALRLQRLRVDAIPKGAIELPAEQRALQAMQSVVELHERSQEAIGQVERLMRRTWDDLKVAESASTEHWPIIATQKLADAASKVWDYELFSVSDTNRIDGRSVTVEYGVTVGKSVGALLLFFVGWALAWGFSHLVMGWIVRRLGLSAALGRVMQRWVMTLLMLGVLLVVLKLARIPLTVFAFLGGALAIGIGFGTQNIIKNLISGVIILFERKIRVGDIVTIDAVSGTVTAVDLRATTVQGFDGINAIVPNSLLLENRVSNWSIGSPTVRRTLLVGLSYGQDTRRASQVLMNCLNDHNDVLTEPAPEVLFDNFGDDAQVLRLQYWVRLGGGRPGPTIDSDLRHAIAENFVAEKLVIAFPQRDVHLDLQAPLEVRLEAPRTTRQTARHRAKR